MFRYIWTEHRLASLVLAAALTAAVFFAVRLVAFSIYWSDPAHRTLAPEDWMTPGYVAMSWDVPREVVGAALNLGPDAPRRQTLAEIAAARGMEIEDLISELEAVLLAYRAAQE